MESKSSFIPALPTSAPPPLPSSTSQRLIPIVNSSLSDRLPSTLVSDQEQQDLGEEFGAEHKNDGLSNEEESVLPSSSDAERPPTTTGESVTTNPTASAPTVIDPTFQQKVISEILRPSIWDDIQQEAKDKKFWQRVETYCLTIAQILQGCSAFAAFASGYFQLTFISYISGSVGILGILVSKFASYAHIQIGQQITALNNDLRMIGIDQWSMAQPPEVPEAAFVKMRRPFPSLTKNGPGVNATVHGKPSPMTPSQSNRRLISV